MDLNNIKRGIHHKNMQAIILNDSGVVLSSDDTLIGISPGLQLLSDSDVFLGMSEFIDELALNEEFKLDCIETEFRGRSSIYDFLIKRLPDEKGRKVYLLIVYDLEDIYRKVIDLRQERNEVRIYAEKLSQAHSKLKQAQLQLVSSERMASVGLLAAGMSHEINNPLNYVFNGVALIKENLADPSIEIDKISEMLSIIETGAERIKKVVDYLKIFDSTGQSDRKEVDIHTTIDKTLDLVMFHSKGDTKIEKDYAAENIQVSCSPGKLSQALFNLLTNAITFVKEASNPRIKVATQKKEDQLFISITDNGVGIPMEIQKQVFDPFFTTKKMGTGKGLGLSVAHIIIEEHNGRLSFDSEEGVGTTFSIELPMS